MFIYKPDNRVFKSRLEAKLYLGTANLNKMIKNNDERLIIINDNLMASFELQKNNGEYPTETET